MTICVETAIKLYEELLAKSKAIAEGWCLTFNTEDVKDSALKKLAEKRRKLVFSKSSKKLRARKVGWVLRLLNSGLSRAQ